MQEVVSSALADAEQLLEQAAALLGERAVAGDPARVDRLLDVAELVAGEGGPVERDAVAGHALYQETTATAAVTTMGRFVQVGICSSDGGGPFELGPPPAR